MKYLDAHKMRAKVHTWYLSRIPRIYPWRKNLSCGEISDFYAWQMWRILKFLHMWSNIKFLVMWKMSPHMYNLCCFVVKLILSRFAHFCRKICFVAIYALLCGEKLNQKLPPWRKNDKYEVCLWLSLDQREQFWWANILTNCWQRRLLMEEYLKLFWEEKNVRQNVSFYFWQNDTK